MKIRDAVDDFSSYDSGRREAEIRLDKNESPFSLPPELKSQVSEKLESLSFNRYPDPTSNGLRGKLADFYDLKPGNVVVGSGSDQLISYAVQLFAGNHAVIAPPTFSMYRFYSELAGLEVKEVPLTNNYDLRLKEIKEVLDGAAMIFLCSPNNPTGNVFARETLIKLLKTGKPLILDEAYVEFSGESQFELIEEFENLIVLRTFSKAFGLAGARAGYALAHGKTAEKLLRVKPPYNLSSTSAGIAKVVLENYDVVRERIDRIIDERERIYEEFNEFAVQSKANFLLMDLDAGKYLGSRGVAVREFSGRLEDKIRVTVGTESENDRLINNLNDFISSKVD
ncbi:histidinol-phosphate transaminase [Candidatus Bipolaricaulota bacterium]|nr:histidinol-phosphate transaminase [Candidatus Bipolaricaulota bacterium]